MDSTESPWTMGLPIAAPVALRSRGWLAAAFAGGEDQFTIGTEVHLADATLGA